MQRRATGDAKCIANTHDGLRLSITQTRRIEVAHVGYSAPALIGTSGWNIRLFERQFSIIHVVGRVIENKLECRGAFFVSHVTRSCNRRCSAVTGPAY